MRANRQTSTRPQAKKSAFSKAMAALPELQASDLGRPKSRFKNPIMAGYLEGITQALYDIYAVALATVTIKLTMFAIPQGQTYSLGGVTSFVKTAAHTSMIQAGVLEAPKKHIVRAISVFTEGNVVPVDLQAFLEVFFQFNVNGKSYQDTLVGRLPAGGGMYTSLAGTFTAPQGWMSSANGWPDTRNTYSLAYGGVPIEQQQNFNSIIDPTISGVAATAFTTATTTVSATNPVAGTGIFAHVFLDGILFRAVQ